VAHEKVEHNSAVHISSDKTVLQAISLHRWHEEWS